MTGRLGETLTIGAYAVEDPIVDVTDELSSVGGGLLRNFAVTFDQRRNQATFFRPSYDPITVAPQRSTGLSFTKTPAYWRVAAVVAGDTLVGGVGGLPELRVLLNGQPVQHTVVSDGELTVGQLVAFNMIAGQVTGPILESALAPLTLASRQVSVKYTRTGL